MNIFKSIIKTVAITSTAILISTVAMAADGTGSGANMNAKNFRNELGPQHYQFSVDISEDVFVNPQRYGQITGGMNFIDENGDGICDIAQDSEEFNGLGIGPFVDENEDGIHDDFQTRGAYQALGMNNFVDVDGDGICDNYEANPIDAQ